MGNKKQNLPANAEADSTAISEYTKAYKQKWTALERWADSLEYFTAAAVEVHSDTSDDRLHLAFYRHKGYWTITGLISDDEDLSPSEYRRVVDLPLNDLIDLGTAIPALLDRIQANFASRHAELKKAHDDFDALSNAMGIDLGKFVKVGE